MSRGYDLALQPATGWAANAGFVRAPEPFAAAPELRGNASAALGAVTMQQPNPSSQAGGGWGAQPRPGTLLLPTSMYPQDMPQFVQPASVAMHAWQPGTG